MVEQLTRNKQAGSSSPLSTLYISWFFRAYVDDKRGQENIGVFGDSHRPSVSPPLPNRHTYRRRELALSKGISRQYDGDDTRYGGLRGLDLTPVLIRSGAGYLRVEGKGEGAKRAVAKRISDSDLEPTAIGSWESVRVREASSRTMLRGPR